MYGKDYRYANTRLQGTIVRRKGTNKPLRVIGVVRDGTAHCSTVLRGLERQVHLDELDCTSPELGFVNTDKECFYMARVPKREDWRQGLRENNVTILDKPVRPREKDIYHAIADTYPTFDKCVQFVQEEGGTMAFHKDWAVRFKAETICLVYKYFGVVGEVDDAGNILLRDGYKELQQSCEEAIHEGV